MSTWVIYSVNEFRMKDRFQCGKSIGPFLQLVVFGTFCLVAGVWFLKWRDQPAIGSSTRSTVQHEFELPGLPEGVIANGDKVSIEKMGLFDIRQSFTAPMPKSVLFGYYDKALQANGWYFRSTVESGNDSGRRYCKNVENQSLMATVEVKSSTATTAIYSLSVQASSIAKTICG